ncbi:MAG TPA: hypothetical protein VF221_19500 [Chloroflexota bacterium]
MKLLAALLADAALGIPDGTVMIWRAGITETQATGFPTALSFALVVRLEADREEVATLHRFSLRIEHEGRELVPWSPSPLVVKAPPPSEPRAYINIVINLRFVVPSEGEGFIESVVDDDINLPRLYFRTRLMPVILGQPPPVGGPPPR